MSLDAATEHASHGNNRPLFITAAIPYVNGAPHLGHAYELVAADSIARFARADGFDVRFLYGVSEHGQKIAQTAEKMGITPLELCNSTVGSFHALQQAVVASNDDFIRTSEARHKESVLGLWRAMLANGDLYLDKYAGWYSVRDEAYYNEDETYLKDNVRYGPQGTPVEWVEADSYFFKLSSYQDKLLAFYEANPDFIQPASRRNEVIAFVKSGLRDLSMSRTNFSWGIPIPNAPGHVMYVWPDELTNYIAALGAFSTNDTLFKKYWPAHVHIVGKDIVRFHAVYWPAFLMSAGVAPPRAVHGHGFIYAADGEKMSKSAGNVIDPLQIIAKYGADPFRYYVLREIAYGQDGRFDLTQFPVRCNADLANEFGNLAQRCLAMINKNCDGRMPAYGVLTEADETALKAPQHILPALRAAMSKYEIHQALAALWRVMSDTNGYFASQAPWGLKQTDPARMATVLWVTANTVRQLAILAAPFIPVGTAKLLDLLAVPTDARSFAALPQHLKEGTALPTPIGIYPRMDLTTNVAD